jgi:invasion protein IalB
MREIFMPGTNLALFTLIFMLAMLTLCAGAEAKPEQGKAFKDWTIACETTAAKEKKCYASQTQTMKDGGKQLLKFMVGYLGPKQEPTAVVILPLGIYLPAGALFKVDKNPDVRLAIQSCVPDGCRSTVTLDKNALKALREGTAMVVSVMSADASNKQVNIPVSLKGFKSAFDSL